MLNVALMSPEKIDIQHNIIYIKENNKKGRRRKWNNKDKAIKVRKNLRERKERMMKNWEKKTGKKEEIAFQTKK